MKVTRMDMKEAFPIDGMDDFLTLCRALYADYHNTDIKSTFVVWVCKTIQNYKCFVSSYGTDCMAEYTYNGDQNELYEDMYQKISKRIFEGD